MKLSVVILNYNVRYFLELCIKSVLRATASLEAEIIVIDNNSPDDSCQMVKQEFPELTLIENKENVGFAKANNQAVKVATGEYVCILNPDTVVAEDTFEKLIQFASTKKNLGIVGCKLVDGTGQFLPESKRNIPYVKAAIKKMLGASNEYYANHLTENQTGEVDILVGAFMFVERRVYEAIEGFDEDYFMYGEDIDISYKALKAGYTNYYYGDTTVIHYKGESTLKDKKYAKRFYGAMQIFYKKHFKKNLLFDGLVWAGLKIAFFLRKGPGVKQKEVKQYYLVAKKGVEVPSQLQETLEKPLILSELSANYEKDSELIFDAKSLGYKEIIEQLSQLGVSKDLSFKILPCNSQFVIGSDDSINRGEVLLF